MSLAAQAFSLEKQPIASALQDVSLELIQGAACWLWQGSWHQLWSGGRLRPSHFRIPITHLTLS
jgi:hypothetical protein